MQMQYTEEVNLGSVINKESPFVFFDYACENINYEYSAKEVFLCYE